MVKLLHYNLNLRQNHIQNSFFEKDAKPTFQTRTEIHSHFGRIIRRLAKLLSFVVALLFDGSFKINISTQHQINLNDNLEGQRQKCSTKVLFKVKPVRIFHILGRLPSLFKERYCLCRLMAFFFGSILSAKVGVAFHSPLSAAGFEINVKILQWKK